jgi:peptidyl-prolyl cis-trans isomerase D
MALISTLRNRMGKIVIAFVAVSMFAFILTDLFQSNSFLLGNSNSVGEIAGNDISYEEFQAKVEELSYNFTINNGRNPLSEDLELIRQEAWQTLILENVFEAQYAKLGITVTDAEIVDMVQGNNINPQIQQFFVDPNTGVFDRSYVVSFLQSLNSAPPQQRASWLAFESSLAPARALAKYENLLEKTRFANKYEAKAEYEKTESVSVDYLYVPFFSVADSTIEVEDSELQSYLSSHEDEYQREESKDLAYVVFDIVPSADDSAFVQQEVRQIYESFANTDNDSLFASINSDGITPYGTYKPNNFPGWLQDESVSLEVGFISEPEIDGNNYSFFKISDAYEGDEEFVKASHILFKAEDETDAAKAEAKAEARRVLRQISNGADFADMAGQYGTDGTASRGGDLGWFGQNSSFVQEFKDAVFAHRGDGLLRDVVETEFGYHIIKVTEPKTKTVYKVARIEKELFASDMTLNEIYRQAELFAAEAEGSEGFYDLASQNGLEVKTANRIRKNDKRVGTMTNARTIVFWLFNKADIGSVSEVFELEDQYVVALQTGEQEEGTADLADVRAEITRKVRDGKKASIIIEKLNGLDGSYDEIKNGYGEGARTGTATLTLSSNSFPGVGFAPEAIGTAYSLQQGEATLPFEVQNGIVMLTMTERDGQEELSSYEDYRAVVTNRSGTFRRRETPFTFQSIYNALTENASIEDERYKFY